MKALSTNTAFWRLSPDDVSRELDTNIVSGISNAEAQKRLEQFGRNAIESSKRAPGIKIFLDQLKSPLIVILIAAGVVTLSINHYRDAAFIFIAVVVNTILGFYQENKAERALSELKTYLRQRARVIRDGKEREVDAEELVPGDLIRLAQGDRVPADARVTFANDFQVDEAILTGESLPVPKSVEVIEADAGLADQSNMLFAGTLVTQGISSAIICRTRENTELGRIAALIGSQTKEETPLQVAIKRFSIRSSAVLGALTVVVFVIGVLAGYSVLDMFLTSVAIAVSAIPEGLPVSLTVILAVGVQRMAKRKGVVRKLVAAEALGSTTVILTDKTGTLTMAQMQLSRVIPFNSTTERALLVRALSNANVLIENPEEPPSSWRLDGRIMETALVRSAVTRNISINEITGKGHVLQSLPFNATRKFSAALILEGTQHRLVVLGAPDILIGHSSLGAHQREELLARIHELAVSGERVLGLATIDIADATNFSFTDDLPLSKLSIDGLITFRDPVRAGIKETIARVTCAGIKTVIMTGDHKGTAIAVAREIGLSTDGDSVLDASELAALTEDELRERLPRLSVISRVTPFDKLRIVRLFQATGETVAMTGDGVNDAPSIKQADVGIAMGSGTEVAQSVADLVLLDDNFETIVAAVEEGRQILGNIRKVLVYLLSNVTDGLILIGGSLLAGIPLPLNALQILWVNFFTDSFPAIAFAFERERGGLTKRHSSSKTRLFDPAMKFLIIVIGVSTSLLLFAIYFTLYHMGYDETLVRTFVFAAFGTYTLFVALSVRSLEKSIFTHPIHTNPYLTGGILIGLVLMAVSIYVPLFQRLFDTVALPPMWLLGVLAVGVVNIAMIEFGKWVFRLKTR